jgi:hypothetical protein
MAIGQASGELLPAFPAADAARVNGVRPAVR